MAKIQNLHPRPLADGTVAWHWKPSPRCRAAGWDNEKLGIGPGAAKGRKPRPPAAIVTRANEKNARLDAWDLGCTQLAAPAVPVPKKWTFQDLVDAYRASPAFALKSKDHPEGLAPATRREYESRLGQLSFWAQDGTLPIRALDADMVKDLNTELRTGSIWKRAGMLRVLRLLTRWALAQGLLDKDPTAAVEIPATPSRQHRLDWQTVDAIAEKAGSSDALILRVAFWSLQRRDDLRLFNRLSWRVFENLDPRDRPALANPKGEVKGFRLQQHKTGKWVDCPMPPFLHAAIEAAFERSQWLFPHSLDASLPVSGDVMRRRVKPLLVAAGHPEHQLRDMRRSGMTWLSDMGALASDLCVVSGHQLFGRKTILDTYMVPDTLAACKAIAAACRTLAAIEAREKEQEQPQ